MFYRSQFWRLQKPFSSCSYLDVCFIGHNFGDYKNLPRFLVQQHAVLSVTILETTKTVGFVCQLTLRFYRSQFWRLQKLERRKGKMTEGFIGHNFGDYKNNYLKDMKLSSVLSVTILETTKTTNSRTELFDLFYRSQFWRLQKPQIVSANYTIKVRIYSA